MQISEKASCGLIRGRVGVCPLPLSVHWIRLMRPNPIREEAGCRLKAPVERAGSVLTYTFHGACGRLAKVLWFHQCFYSRASPHSLTMCQRPLLSTTRGDPSLPPFLLWQLLGQELDSSNCIYAGLQAFYSSSCSSPRELCEWAPIRRI